MSATDYSIDLRDIRFVLFEQLKMDETLGAYEAFQEFDRDTYDSFLDEAERMATQVLAPANAPGDVQGCRFDGEGNVSVPDAYKPAWAEFIGAGWTLTRAPAEYGGMGLPHSLGAALGELFTGACPGLSTYSGLSIGAANMLYACGSDELKDRCLEKLYSCEWAGTMCLTEAGAGSAVGDNRCKAHRTDEAGVYHLEGEKIFISGGDQDLTENILHMVLARTPDAPSGTRGLSIFVVPKFDWDGARNDAWVVGIEHKMGLNGSGTCTLALGSRGGPCRGYLIGAEGEGMKIMFHMMNEARLAVGVQGLSSGSAAYQNALSYARERVQGTSLRDMRDADAPRVAITAHPDVRRMLMFQKVAVETMRSLLYTNALRMDIAEHTGDEALKAKLEGLVSLLIPICKAHCTDLSFEVTRLALQTYGGYGYIKEYPVEQHMRDNKIASIYEGTNGIQAMDLLGRKMRKGQGALFMQWIGEATKLLGRATAVGGFETEVAAFQKAQGALGAAAMHLGMTGRNNMEAAMLYATPFLEMFGTVLLGLHALEQAIVAKEALDAGAPAHDVAFYRGKLLNAKFYVSQFLPRAVALGKTIQSDDLSCLDEALFA